MCVCVYTLVCFCWLCVKLSSLFWFVDFDLRVQSIVSSAVTGKLQIEIYSDETRKKKTRTQQTNHIFVDSLRSFVTLNRCLWNTNHKCWRFVCLFAWFWFSASLYTTDDIQRVYVILLCCCFLLLCCYTSFCCFASFVSAVRCEWIVQAAVCCKKTSSKNIFVTLMSHLSLAKHKTKRCC